MRICLSSGGLPQLVRCDWHGGLPRLARVPDQAPGDALAARADAHAARCPCSVPQELQDNPALGPTEHGGGTDGGELGVRISREEAARLRAGAGARSASGACARLSAPTARASQDSAARGDARKFVATRLLPVLEDRHAPAAQRMSSSARLRQDKMPNALLSALVPCVYAHMRPRSWDMRATLPAAPSSLACRSHACFPLTLSMLRRAAATNILSSILPLLCQHVARAQQPF